MSTNLLNIVSNSFDDFHSQIENFLAGPGLELEACCRYIKMYLESLPHDLTNYTYSPKSTHYGTEVKFYCKQGYYQLTVDKHAELSRTFLKQDNISSETKQHRNSNVIYDGPVNDECLSKVTNVNTKQMMDKYQNSSFPYTATISDNGDTIIGGSMSFTGTTFNLSNPEDLQRLMAMAKK